QFKASALNTAYIGAMADRTLIFGRANFSGYSESMRLDTAGNLGLGTKTPLSKMDVSGGLAVGSGYAGLSAAPTDGLIVAGNVGIGTTAPDSPLTVSGNLTGLQAPGTNWANTSLHLVAKDNKSNYILVDTHGNLANTAGLAFRNSHGTAAAPTATQTNDAIG